VGEIGSHGAAKHVRIINFPTTEQAVLFMRQECNCTKILGLLGSCPDSLDDNGYNIQIVDKMVNVIQKGCNIRSVDDCDKYDSSNLFGKSYPVHYNRVDQFGNGNIGLVVSKENRGLPLHLAEHCESFLHVPYPLYPNATSSIAQARLLNFASCISITLHELTSQIGYDETTFHKNKFSVSPQKPIWNHTNSKVVISDDSGIEMEENGSDISIDAAESNCLSALFATEYD
jgi:hypothetical protein